MVHKVFNFLFDLIYKKISYTFAVVVFALSGAYFGAFYAYIFGSAVIPEFTASNHSEVFLAFVFSTLFASIGHSIQYGILSPFSVPGLERQIQKINSSLRPDVTLRHKNTLELESLLKYLIQLPKHNMIASFGYAIFVFSTVAITHLWSQKPFWELAFVFIGWSTAVFVYCGFSYIITDYFTGQKRVEIKVILSKKNVRINKEFGIFSLKGKFIFLLTLILLSLTILSLFVSLGNSTPITIGLFIFMTFLEASLLTFLYFQSINMTLDQINLSANNLAMGGSGALPLLSIDREFIRFAENFEKATSEVGKIRDNLQQLVEEKTSELRHSLDIVEKLKSQQDGDYFLTSLLIQPLSLNKSTGDKVHVDFLMKQKKTFVFHGKENDIGGDICIAKSVQLRNREFTVFLNADAMGKSLQGAGGALVLGAAVQSILERTIAVQSVKQLYAERWLKNAFLELHRLFEGFDCSMLVSLVMGLIDDKTGLVYYINAEHPWSVLYRDGKAEFIETSGLFRKLGTPFTDDQFQIRTFQLREGDVLILGSDGRDDIEIDSENGVRILNEDESLFLKHVENGTGKLEKIYESILSTGKLTDDFSLLKISYRRSEPSISRALRKESLDLLRKAKAHVKDKNFDSAILSLQEAGKFHPESAEIRRDLIRLHFRKKDYKQAATLLTEYIEDHPGDGDMIYLASFCFKKNQEYGKAIDMAERIRLRNPGHPSNLIQLAELYLKVGNVSKAEKILSLAQVIEPNSKELLILSKNLEREKSLASDGLDSI
ncbi:PP2C family protein-serine/threonine phosphatase [Leptospira stimsonii]|uniref:Serine/threonine-protein phosphatase n=1 Tax=Leptospira stimsonii TaxID=2202203 RepID=A0A4R9L070_9LEPT|nr:PP2C family protein-serine/threonine phosphatase [Leptospira stimsonii]RHX84580.1 serine/threonine protein phosphatase [Leptospira stimsonii]TGK23648.1 serine/threonine-protein phosphatase [Leptospira stimsonii]TGM08046.1 serine/threonine-protein phosphatase [Leptospira stimsonii]